MLWGAIVGVIMYIEPELLRDVVIPGTYLPFIVLVTITVLYTFVVFTETLSVSLMFTGTIILGLVLTILKLMHWGLILVLLLTLVMESWYTYHRHEKINPTNEQKNRGTGL